MRIWFEAAVKYCRENEQGLLKTVSEKYLVDSVSFSETEAILYDRLGSQIRGDFQVTAITKTNIVDVFLYEDNDVWFKCKVTYRVADADSGKEKKVSQYMLLTASDAKQAFDRINESLSNMLVSFDVPVISLSPIVEVFPYESDNGNTDGWPEGNFRPIVKED